MRAKEFITEAVKQRLDAKCWKGKHKEGTKIKGGVRVNNCVPNESIGRTHISPSGVKTNMPPTDDDYAINYGKQGLVAKDRKARGVDVATGSKDVDEDWQKTNKQDKTDGMSSKAVKAYRRENPGSKLQTAVTTKPSKLKAGSKDAKRRKSFCARMSGVDGPMKDEKGRPTAKAKALSRWNC